MAGVPRRRKSQALLDTAPLMPAVVHQDQSLEAGQRLADLLGLIEPPVYFGSLSAGAEGLSQRDLDALGIRVREAAATGASFSLPLRPQGSVGWNASFPMTRPRS